MMSFAYVPYKIEHDGFDEWRKRIAQAGAPPLDIDALYHLSDVQAAFGGDPVQVYIDLCGPVLMTPISREITRRSHGNRYTCRVDANYRHPKAIRKAVAK